MDQKERLATILIAPLMTCSARLPVYTLIIGAFIPAQNIGPGIGMQGLVLFALYLFGIVGAMLAAAMTETTLGKTMGVLAVALAAVNVFGGFMVTRRMLEMFRKKDKPAKAAAGDKA